MSSPKVTFRRAFTVVLGVGLAAAAILLWQWLSEPATGTLQMPEPESSAPAAGTYKYEGEYFDLYYPDSYRLAENHNPATGVLESVLLPGSDASGKRFTAAVRTGSLSGDSGVVMRQRSELYSESSYTGQAGNFVLFTKTADGWEQTAFLASGELVYSLSLIDPNGRERPSEMRAFLDGLRL